MTRRSREGDYRAARVGAAAALTAVLIAILLIDTLTPEYKVDPIALVVLATLIASLLSVDLPDLLKRGD